MSTPLIDETCLAIKETEFDTVSQVAAQLSNIVNNNKDEMSMAATDASIAGSSVAATEAEEDAASYILTGPAVDGILTGNVFLTKDSADNDDEDAAPMHIHVLRTPPKLRGSGHRSRSSSRSRPGSRRNSTSPKRGRESPSGSFKCVASDAASLASSIEEDLDPDILLDRFGFHDLDPNATQEEFQELLKKHLSGSGSLPTLNERMSEETMEDVHAFQDLVFQKKSKVAGTIGSPSNSGLDSSLGSGSLEEVELGDNLDTVKNKASIGGFSGLEALNEEEEDEEEDEHAVTEDTKEDMEEVRVNQSPASSISEEEHTDVKVSDSLGQSIDVVLNMPINEVMVKEHSLSLNADSSVMAVEDKLDNEELNLQDQQEESGIILPSFIIEELKAYQESRDAESHEDFETTDDEVEQEEEGGPDRKIHQLR